MTTRRASDRDPELDKPTEAPAAPKQADPLKEGRPGEYVRVRHPKTGDHYTTTRSLASKAGAKLLPGHLAVDTHGYPLPRKTNTSKES
ncbi:MAG: hypothetical protein L0G94_10720 [Brachybacterium sp.]|uniref:hypothetical protein n=1 Tax=Brachybacterium sp. TaxID=1891286 RepID=UPI0026489EF3|nr:hypothetical protein [Brachybacterium sp.]MDN5687129.1 hypothetical protein [Brachybacterium sp.]